MQDQFNRPAWLQGAHPSIIETWHFGVRSLNPEKFENLEIALKDIVDRQAGN